MKEQTAVICGADSAGVAIAGQLHDAIVADGATKEQARSQIWLADAAGLLETIDIAAPTILLGTYTVPSSSRTKPGSPLATRVKG